MRRPGPRPLARALELLADELAPATLLAEVQRAWPHAVGTELATHARPIAERAGVLTIACSSAVWAQELDLLAEPVVARLNEAFGRPAVRGLRAQVASTRP